MEPTGTTRYGTGQVQAIRSGLGRLPAALRYLAAQVFAGRSVRDGPAEPAGVFVRPQTFEDGQRLDELRVRGGMVLSLAILERLGADKVAGRLRRAIADTPPSENPRDQIR